MRRDSEALSLWQRRGTGRHAALLHHRATVYPPCGEPFYWDGPDVGLDLPSRHAVGGTLAPRRLSDSPVGGNGCGLLRHAQTSC